ncbi:ribonuclease P protein component, partial [Burkholderia cenocepacia]|nr:ribonuclease P protein component [Burkholderia cenocepacia]
RAHRRELLDRAVREIARRASKPASE